MAAYRLLISVLAAQLCSMALGKELRRGCPTGTDNYTYAVPNLPLPTSSYLPTVDNTTMFTHSTRHVLAGVTALNLLLDRYPSLRTVPLADLVWKIGVPTFNKEHGISLNDSIAIRSNAGILFNHGFFWKVITAVNTSTPANANLSPELLNKITTSFGSPAGMLAALRDAANNLYASGWAWIIVRAKGNLEVETTPLEDSPIMRGYVRATDRGVPILGIDVWEHSYYLRFRNLRPNYVAAFLLQVDWKTVQRNYDLAMAGKVDNIWC